MNTPQPMTGSPVSPPDKDEEKRKRRNILVMFLLLLFVPACLWLVSQLALLELGMDEAHESLLSQLQATYAPWGASSFGPLDPTLIGTIRAEQLTWAAGGPGVGVLIPFVGGGPGLTQISANASTTPTASLSGTPTPTTIYTSTPVIIYYPGTTTATLSFPLTPGTPGGPTATPGPITPGPNPTRTPSPGTADLGISKDDGATVYLPGTVIVYTIVASNAGPMNANNARVRDNFPAQITSVSWTCAASGGSSCPAGGSGNINVLVDLLSGGSATFTVNATVSPSATGTLTNTATINPSSSTNDPFMGDNSATDSDTFDVQANLGITKTDFVATYTPGGGVTYTIVASNAGPSAVTNATVTDTFPAQIGSANWTCTGAGGGSCPASGSGNINASVDLPVGGSVTFTINATTTLAGGDLVNTATVAVPAGVTDPAPGNNSSTDTDTSNSINLAITKTDDLPGLSKTKAWPGGMLTYTIVASNTSGSDVFNAVVADTFPTAGATLGGPFTWTCSGTAGTNFACPGAGTTVLNDTVDIPAGGSITYQVDVILNAAAPIGGSLVNTATIATPVGISDPVPGNNSATDTDTIGRPNVVVTLAWDYGEKDDFDLWVVDPSSPNHVIKSPNNPDAPQNSSGGGTISSGDQNCSNIFSDPTSETVDWSLGFPQLGTYFVYAYFFQSCTAPPPTGVAVTWDITVTVDGNVVTTATGSHTGIVTSPVTGCPGLLLLPGTGTFVPTCPPRPYDPSTQNPNFTATFTLQ